MRTEIIEDLKSAITESARGIPVTPGEWASLVATAGIEMLLQEHGPEWTIAQLQAYMDEIESRTARLN